MSYPIARVINLVPGESQRLRNVSETEALRLLLAADVKSVCGLEGSFALVAQDGQRVVLARSLDRPLRYFLAKASEGPVLIVAERSIPCELYSYGASASHHNAAARRVSGSESHSSTILRSPAWCVTR